MITDEQVCIACKAFYGKHTRPDCCCDVELQVIRRTLEAYEQSKWVIDGRLPPKAGERDDGNWYSQYVYDPDHDTVVYYDSESDDYHRPNGSRSRDPKRYYLLPDFKE